MSTRLGIPRLDVFAELIAALAATAIMVRSLDRREWSFVGLDRASIRPREMLTAFAVGAAAIGGTCAVLFATGLMVFESAPAGAPWVVAALRVSVVLLAAGLAEEVICRGYLLSVVRDTFGVGAAVVGTSLLFGALHLANDGATPQSVAVVTLAGLLLATVRVVLRSLYAAWMTHFAWNAVMAVGLHAPVSGIQFEGPGYTSVTTGPAWISGGTWGPEGGLVAALGMIGGLAYFYARHRREES